LGVLVVALVAIALLSAATGSASAAARPITRPPVIPGSRYLALGDSVTFGYMEPNVVPAPNYNNQSSFIGYPQMVGAALRLKVTNSACAGETSSSFINTSAPSNGCTNSPPPNTSAAYRAHFPLHVSYTGSQLSFAVKYLRHNRNVRLVSLEIGANDIFLCQKQTRDGCLSAAEQQAVFTTVGNNVRTILSTIRNKAHYRGQLLLVNYYSLNYSSPLVTGIVNGVNQAQDAAGKPFRVLIANGNGEFYAGALHSGGDPCKAGLLTQLSTGSCGVHPSYGGQSLLALAVEKAARR
jgi:lysophospholipase L1-like esterase